MKIKQLDKAYLVSDTKINWASNGIFPPYIRVASDIWLMYEYERWVQLHSKDVVKYLETEFTSINGAMHEQLELFND